ncbi:MAG: HAD family hydrolase [Planctomycetes bacterium]|nr:HAD family hydrolase [Planctomycetota bacterium]
MIAPAPRLLVFDMDGTLTDTLPVMVETMNRSIRAVLGAAPPDEALVREGLGIELLSTVQALLPTHSPRQHDDVVEHYCASYRAVEAELGLRLFVGVAAALKLLAAHGFILTVGTGKSRAGLDRVLPLLDLQHTFTHTRTADETAHKPDPTMLLELMHVCACDPTETLMIGDTTFDVDMAHAAGVRSVALRSGTHTMQRLEASRPTMVLNSVADLPRVLLSVTRESR